MSRQNRWGPQYPPKDQQQTMYQQMMQQQTTTTTTNSTMGAQQVQEPPQPMQVEMHPQPVVQQVQQPAPMNRPNRWTNKRTEMTTTQQTTRTMSSVSSNEQQQQHLRQQQQQQQPQQNHYPSQVQISEVDPHHQQQQGCVSKGGTIKGLKRMHDNQWCVGDMITRRWSYNRKSVIMCYNQCYNNLLVIYLWSVPFFYTHPD